MSAFMGVAGVSICPHRELSRTLCTGRRLPCRVVFTDPLSPLGGFPSRPVGWSV